MRRQYSNDAGYWLDGIKWRIPRSIAFIIFSRSFFQCRDNNAASLRSKPKVWVFHSLVCCASWVVQAKSSTAEILVTTRLYLQSQGVEASLSPFLSPCLHIVSSFSLAVLFILDLFWFLLWLKPWTVLPIFRKTMRYMKDECISGACHILRLSLERNEGIVIKHT